jgi:hypothetical protein
VENMAIWAANGRKVAWELGFLPFSNGRSNRLANRQRKTMSNRGKRFRNSGIWISNRS